MSKASGGTKLVEKYRRSAHEARNTAEEMISSGKYSIVEHTQAGGIFAIEKGKAGHKADEIEAGRHMADAGYQVTLKDETGQVKTPDGYVYSFTYEQRTPNKTPFKKALDHAADKKADIAVIYDKNYIYNRDDVEKGLRLFEEHRQHRFERIIVIAQNGKVYEHIHNK